MNPFPLPPGRLAVVLRSVAVLGLVASVVGLIAGWLLLGQTASALEASLALTDDTLQALDASAGVADDAVATLGVTLEALEGTAAELDLAFEDGERLMHELADVVRDDVAASVGAVDDSLPGLISVAGTIDSTLSALASLPIGPDYRPDQSFGESLRDIAVSLDGLPERLVEQADLIDETGTSLSGVGAGVTELTVELARFDETLSQTSELLATYETTITEGREVVASAQDDLGSQFWIARIAVVLAALAFAAMQVVPLQMAAMVDRQLQT